MVPKAPVLGHSRLGGPVIMHDAGTRYFGGTRMYRQLRCCRHIFFLFGMHIQPFMMASASTTILQLVSFSQCVSSALFSDAVLFLKFWIMASLPQVQIQTSAELCCSRLRTQGPRGTRMQKGRWIREVFQGNWYESNRTRKTRSGRDEEQKCVEEKIRLAFDSPGHLRKLRLCDYRSDLWQCHASPLSLIPQSRTPTRGSFLV
ncbi:hypothetical protein BKA81DRAFT_157510 [Phyllosticta paracitricarpa]|uniref:Uncharacterized protein n=2 Tax=Phyllosticta TaxID=121621 RepID=A0ABR1LGY7_9PEZI